MKNNINRKNVSAALVGLIIGALIILLIRFFTYNPHRVHYHANFAVFINGKQEHFRDNFYYEEIGAACVAAANITPHDRAHMHEHEAGLVHVHDHAVTWENFFNNIGWDVNPRYINTPAQLYVVGSTDKVTFIVNGQVVSNIENLVIGDKDRLLVDYGNNSPTNLQQEQKAVPNTAAKEDVEKDPASCGGSAPVTFHERITHLF